MSGVSSALAAASLVLLACIVAIGNGQGCDDVVCCPGKICVEETTAKGMKNKTKCESAASCDQIDCPAGQVCVRDGKSVLGCRVSCSNVVCPESYTCEEKKSRTECVWESSANCTGMHCPQGTTCQIVREGKKDYAVCLGQSCSSVNCFDGTQCYNGTRTSVGNKATIIVEAKEGNVTVSLKTLHTKETKEKSKSRTGTVVNTEDIAICLQDCEGNTVCPEGLVCDDQNHKLTCRAPHSCDEMSCAPNQECQELECGIRKPKTPRPTTKPASKRAVVSGQGPRRKPNQKHIILQCVNNSTEAPPTITESTEVITESTEATPESTEATSESTVAISVATAETTAATTRPPPTETGTPATEPLE